MMLQAMVLVWRTLEPSAPPQTPEPRVTLRWDAPQSCPTQAELEQEIRRYVGAAATAADKVDAAATVNRDATTYRLSLTLRTGAGQARTELASSQCQVLADAVALKVAMALDPMAVVTGLHNTNATALETPTTPAKLLALGPVPPRPGPAPLGPGADTRVSERRPFGVHAGVGVSAGDLPGIGAGARFGAAWQPGVLRLQLTAGYWPRRVVRARDGRGGAISLGEVAAFVCVVGPVGRRFEVPVCLGPEFGAMSSEGRGVADPQRTTQLWVAAVAQPGIVFKAIPNRLSLRLGLDAVIPIRRLGFRVSPTEEIYRVPQATIRSFLGLELRLGHKESSRRR